MNLSLRKSRWVGATILILIAAIPAHGFDTEPLEKVSNNIDADIVMLIIYVLLALVISFLCSVAEAVLLSITPSYIEGQKKKRPKFAILLKKLKQDNIDRSLAAILTLNTIAHTVGAIGAGAKAAVVFGSAWFGVFSGIMTVMILFLSEIIPKTIGAVYWAKLVVPAAIFVKTLIVSLYPIVSLAEKLTRFISHRKGGNIFSRDEFIAMTSMALKTGGIDIYESRIIHNLLRFESLKVVDIMTPRTVVAAISESMKISDSLKQVSQSPFTRLLLYKKDTANITGFVFKEDVLICAAQDCGDEKKIKTLKRDVLAVPHFVSLTYLLERFLKYREHIAIVVNEYGEMDGLVTLEDLIETIMGMEIIDKTQHIENVRTFALKKWVERAKAMGLETDILDKDKRTKKQNP